MLALLPLDPGEVVGAGEPAVDGLAELGLAPEPRGEDEVGDLEPMRLPQLGEAGQGVLDRGVVTAGSAFHFPPGTVHRVTALDDTTILEVSTPHPDDVVRLEDRYGREGTSAP